MTEASVHELQPSSGTIQIVSRQQATVTEKVPFYRTKPRAGLVKSSILLVSGPEHKPQHTDAGVQK